MNTHTQFDQYLEKVILKNKLISDEQFQKAKSLHVKHPELRLLDILLRTQLISQKHATLIEQKYQAQTTTITSNENHTAVASSDEIEESHSLRHTHQTSTKRFDNLESYFIEARNQEASDLYINVNSPPILRKNGSLTIIKQSSFSAEKTKELLFSSLNESQQEKLKSELNLELCLEFQKHGRYRSCYLKQRNGWEGSFRIISQTIPNLEILGLPTLIKKFTDYTQGLVLVTGPSGSGKSSTLASMIDLINQKRTEHIITLEDPIEFKYKPIKSHISQREVRSHTKSFSNALRAALREDPDVILVGEMRDFETASLAVTAAETGHLVFSTLHTVDAAQTVVRLLDYFPPDQQNQIRAMVSESLRGIICQRLIPKIDGSSRIIALEIMFNIPAISSLIRDDKLFQIRNMMRINQSKGMRLMDNSVKELLEKKQISSEEAHYAIVDSMLFQQQKNGGI